MFTEELWSQVKQSIMSSASQALPKDKVVLSPIRMEARDRYLQAKAQINIALHRQDPICAHKHWQARKQMLEANHMIFH